MAMELVVLGGGLLVKSGGAGLLEEMRLPGRSILRIFPCDVKVNCPSFVFRL